MNINEELGSIIEKIIADVTANVVNTLDNTITSAINHKLTNYNYDSQIKNTLDEILEKKLSGYSVDGKKLENRLIDKIKESLNNVEKQTSDQITSAVQDKINSINFDLAMRDAVSVVVNDRLESFKFPDNSISIKSLNFENKISGDYIFGGIIENFGSTGIEDKASQVAITILDDNTVIENNLLTKDLTVQGSMTINGEFVVNGEVSAQSNFYKNLLTNLKDETINGIDSSIFEKYNTTIYDNLKNNGLDLTKISLNGQPVILDHKLGPSILESNLQKVGLLKELQVSGESFISETLYTTKKRVGINTIEPSAVLSVWDDEIEITAGKQQKEIGMLGTPRNHKLVLTSNLKDNIMLNPDGSVSVSDLRIGSMRFTTSEKPPNFVSERNHIVYNTNPNPGGPLGWVCLGGANWANFGIID